MTWNKGAFRKHRVSSFLSSTYDSLCWLYFLNPVSSFLWIYIHANTHSYLHMFMCGQIYQRNVLAVGFVATWFSIVAVWKATLSYTAWQMPRCVEDLHHSNFLCYEIMLGWLVAVGDLTQSRITWERSLHKELSRLGWSVQGKGLHYVNWCVKIQPESGRHCSLTLHSEPCDCRKQAGALACMC